MPPKMDYLACEQQHVNAVPSGDRYKYVGRACAQCGSRLQSTPVEAPTTGPNW